MTVYKIVNCHGQIKMFCPKRKGGEKSGD